MERTSPEDPRAIAMKESSSFVVERSKPSATLFEMDNEARSSWLRKPGVSGTSGSSKRSSTVLYSRAASCQTGNSSKRSYLAIRYSFPSFGSLFDSLFGSLFLSYYSDNLPFAFCLWLDRKSVVDGKSVDLGCR